MLRVIQSTDSKQAKSYYSAADYYLGNGQELAGRWRGEGAKRLGLDGTIEKLDWEALCENRDPRTNCGLTARQRSDRTVGYDFNFNIPKGVSLLYAETRDERILEALRDSVNATMQDIEQEAQARVRRNGRNENRITGNLAWGEFIHFTSRPVDGVPDPSLHAHCFVFNATYDSAEKKWKAGQFRELKRDAPYFEGLFHSRLGHRLAELGLPIDRTKTGWDLAGIDASLVDRFSRRTAQIERKAKEMGITNPDAKSELGAKTREYKQNNLSFEALQELWRSRMTPQERQVLADLGRRIGGPEQPTDEGAARQSVEFAMNHEFERKSVVPERMLLARALKHAAGKATVSQVLDQGARAPLIVATRNGRRMVTTRSVLAEERRMIDFARRGRGTCRPFVRQLDRFNEPRLNRQQKKAVKHIVESRDRVILLRGAAGVGKTTLLKEAVDAIEKTGIKVSAFAPSAEASRGVLRSDGFKDADTVAALLNDPRKQQAAANGLILIDEAGLMGGKTTAEVFSLAERINSRVLLSGDRYQHASIERGSALRLLEDEAGLKPANVKEIQRQSGEYKAVVKALAKQGVREGFARLDKLGWIREIPVEDRYQQMATDYVETVAKGKTALVVSPTHSEGDRITQEIRRKLRERRMLGQNVRSVFSLRDMKLTEAEREEASVYVPGDVLEFHKNAKGYTRGQRVEVTSEAKLPLDYRERFSVYHPVELKLAPGDCIRITKNGFSKEGGHRLDNGSLYRIKRFDPDGNIVLQNDWIVSKDFGHIAYGYVVTSHASQGKTVDQVFVGQAYESLPASSMEQFYVSVSRGREKVTIYTGNKAELLDAVCRSDERLAAMDLFNDRPDRHRIPLPERPPEPIQPSMHHEREMSYER